MKMKGELEGEKAISPTKKVSNSESTNDDVNMDSDKEDTPQVNGDVSSQDGASPKSGEKVVNGSNSEKMDVDSEDAQKDEDDPLSDGKAEKENEKKEDDNSDEEDSDPLAGDTKSAKEESEAKDPLEESESKDPLEESDPLSGDGEAKEDEDPLTSKKDEDDEDPLTSKKDDDPLGGSEKKKSSESSKVSKKETPKQTDPLVTSDLEKSSRKDRKRKHEEISIEDEDEDDDDGGDPLDSQAKNEDPLGGGDPLADPLGDPLAGDDKPPSSATTKKTPTRSSILRKMRKDEPTLVIIDTNSIVSGKGPIAVPQPTTTSWPSTKRQSTGTSSVSITPTTSKPSTPAAAKASPVSKVQASSKVTSSTKPQAPAKSSPRPSPASTPTPPATRSLQNARVTPRSASPAPQSTPSPSSQFGRNPEIDDSTFVVEAPSFVVPYVYEKESVEKLKGFIQKVKDLIDKESEEKKKEKEEKEKAAKENGVKEGDKDEKMEVDEDGKPKSELEKRLTEAKDETETKDEAKKTPTPPTNKSLDPYFESPLGKMFLDVGMNLIQEFVQTDLLKIQKKKADREGGKGSAATQHAVRSLLKNLEDSKENNEPFHFHCKKCDYCSFRSESRLAMAHHMEVPHMLNYTYKCNFCKYETRAPQEILFHSEAEHNVRGRLERSPLFHQCPLCPFEDNQKGKVTRHIMSCQKRYRADRNQDPSFDWDTPAKLKKRDNMARARPTNPLYNPAGRMHPLLPKMPGLAGPSLTMGGAANIRGRGRPVGSYKADPRSILPAMRPGYPQLMRAVRPGGSPSSALLAGVANRLPRPPTSLYQGGDKGAVLQRGKADAPSISITPLPRQQNRPQGSNMKPGQAPSTSSSQQKTTFVICEICDGYIKDLEQLRNHMQWIHKVKIHPKMIASRPPLNCQKCQYRFFTDQGLERHLLGTHGLVTSSMQEAANKGQDAGRCPICGKVYQWKLLNHVSREHRLTLKPAHLSYKCTVCTATFSMYKQFENHVYSAHSMVAKKVLDGPRASNNKSEENVFKINNEITIIPQPAADKKKASKKDG